MSARSPVRLFRTGAVPLLVVGTGMIGCSSAWNMVIVVLMEPSWLRVAVVLVLLAIPTTLAACMAGVFAYIRGLRRKASVVAGADEMLAWSPAGLDTRTRGVLVLTARTLRFVSSNDRTDLRWPLDRVLGARPGLEMGIQQKLELRSEDGAASIYVADPTGWCRALAERRPDLTVVSTTQRSPEGGLER